ncbi:DNA damage-responsive transcriptional repressor RPH1-like isoform X2 [Bradysia coprophila]|uniref:DNA damage-responsive transcriptional repressor RPH1-like isoform X2 n=1 Tax=Bradysia coprophila TaxID=38358 RepID=UPI00187DB965|nr:DNA damage-responsive transcriptional repressor RPH1-like isoform X2 [Bradysia coprophila]
MAFTLGPSVTVLWQNLIALNSTLVQENEEQRAELLRTNELLQKEMEKSKILQANYAIQQQKLANLCSKMVAVRQIVSYEPNVDHTTNVAASNIPVIVKVESVEPDSMATENNNTNSVPLRINVCNECDKKFCSSYSLKRHMALHLNPEYSCPRCCRKFSRKDYVKRHIKRDHCTDGPLMMTSI